MITDQIIEGDSNSVLQGFPCSAVDLVVTDPPYLVGYKDRYGRTLANDTKPEAVLSVYNEIYRVLRPDAYCVTFCGWTAIGKFAGAWDDAGFRTLGRIVWTKGYASNAKHTEYHHEAAYLLGKGRPPVPACPPSDVQPWQYTGNRQHPTEKAVSVITPLIKAYSRPGDLVLDPFSGSGTTAVAAALSGRRYIGIELERRYCELARRRLAGIQTPQGHAYAA